MKSCTQAGLSSSRLVLLCLLATCMCHQVFTSSPDPTFITGSPQKLTIADDRFHLNGKPFQIISGALHFFRIHPDLWKDRLVRAKSIGINTVEVYVPWNFHEPRQGEFRWTGEAHIERFIKIAEELDLYVLLRAGPYICAEWEFGGFPSWLGSSSIAGGGTMKLRSSDPAYLAHVDRWWSQLFARLRPYMIVNGGSVLMVQIENEYGSCGADKVYLEHLRKLAKNLLGDDVLLYTTDPAHSAKEGTLEGEEVLTTVDFGPGWFYPTDYYSTQKSLNAPGKSPPMNSEYYTGWLSHWGEPMANTSAISLANDLEILLRWANNSGSLNFYMLHGGTNFGFWAGANVDSDGTYMPHITSYDYHSPISEAGDYCQPGIGGACKFDAVKDVISAYTGVTPPPMPPRPVIRAYGAVQMTPVASLVESIEYAGLQPVLSELVLPMEEYDQRWGLILYRTRISTADIAQHTSAELSFGAPVHDYATVLIDGNVVGRTQRNDNKDGSAPTVLLSTAGLTSDDNATVTMDIIVHAMGRQNFGCDAFGAWDFKGLQSTDVRLNGAPILGWQVYSFEFDDLSVVPPLPSTQVESAGARRLLMDPSSSSAPNVAALHPAMGNADEPRRGPVFYRGVLNIQGKDAENVTDAGGAHHLACTYLDTRGWGKGIAWVNGFNLGWYWPTKGPQMTLYVPGPILKPGANDVVFLEVEGTPECDGVGFVDAPNFFGPEALEGTLGLSIL